MKGRTRMAASAVVAVFVGIGLVPPVQGDNPPNEHPMQPGQTKGHALNIGDPISANGGILHSAFPLFDLGGPLPMRYELRHRSGVRGSGEYGPWYLQFYSTADTMLQRAYDTHLDVHLENRDCARFRPNTATNAWVLDDALPVRYALQESGQTATNGYYYLVDPVRELSYVFEKLPSTRPWALPSQLKYLVDRNGNRHTYTHLDDDFHPDAIEDGLGRSLNFSTNAEGYIVTVTDQAGRHADIAYEEDAPDTANHWALRFVTDPATNTTTFHYEPRAWSRGAFAAVERPLGNKPCTQDVDEVSLNRRLYDRVLSQTDAYGNMTTLQYVRETNRVTEVRPDGTAIVYEHFHNLGRPRLLTDAVNNTVHFGQSGYEQTTSITDRLGDTTTIGHHEASGKVVSYRDAAGHLYSNTYTAVDQVFTNPASGEVFTNRFYDLTRRDYPDGTYETKTMDGRGNVLVRRDRNGHQWVYTYNSRGQVLTVTNPEGGVVTYAYNADGTLASRTDSDSGVTTCVHDGYKRLAGINRPDGTSAAMGYDANDRLTSYTDGNGEVTAYTYDANGNLVEVTDPLGHAHSFMHDLMDRVTNVTDSVGPVVSYAYDSLGRIASVTDAGGVATVPAYDPRGWATNMTRAGRSWTATYDDEGVPASVTTPAGQTTTYGTDKLGMVTGVVDALSQVHTYERDAMGRVVRSEDPLGHVRTYAYDGRGRLVSMTAPAVGTATYVRDGLGLITAYTNFNGETWSQGYTPMGRLTAVTNPLGRATAFSYDAGGRLERADFADGTHVALTFDDAGRTRTRRHRGGSVSSFGYDAAGRLLSVTNPAGGVASYSYNPDGTRATGTDTDLGVYSNSYDALRRLVQVAASDGATVRYRYDAFNRITNAVDANGGIHSYAYDADGRLIRAVDPLAHARGYAYDALDRLTNVTDRSGDARRYAYDAAGRMVRSADAEGLVVDHAYDGAGRRTAVTVAGKTWRYGCDGQDRAVSRTTPLGGTMTLGRDAFGSVTAITGPMGRTVSIGRDALQRITSLVDPLGRTNTFAYEARGLPTAASNAVSGASYAYNNLGQLETLTDPNGEDWGFGYTEMGRIETETDPLLQTTTYTRDARGRLAEAAFADGRSLVISYDSAGNVTNGTYTDGTQIAYEYDPLNRLVRATGTTAAVSFAYDAEGRVTATENPGTVFGATYDKAGRLKTATYNNAAFVVTYTYDAASGLLTRVEDGLTDTVLTFRYDAGRRLTGVSRPNGVDTTYTWDDASRLVRIRDGAVLDLCYTLDAAGQVTKALVKAPLAASSLTASGTEAPTFDAAAQFSTAGHAFDARGRQTAKPGGTFTWNDAGHLTVVSDASDTSDLSYNGLGDLVTRSRGAATIHLHYNYAIGLKPIAAESNTGGQFLRYYVWSPGGTLLYMIDAANGNKVHHYHFDRTGSTLALTDAAGAVTDAYAYTPYGRLLAHSGTSVQPFKFCGGFGVRAEGDSDLYQMRARYYDALAGRFLSRDSDWPTPEEPLGLNPYQYAWLDPVGMVDPLGASPENVTLADLPYVDGPPVNENDGIQNQDGGNPSDALPTVPDPVVPSMPGEPAGSPADLLPLVPDPGSSPTHPQVPSTLGAIINGLAGRAKDAFKKAAERGVKRLGKKAAKWFGRGGRKWATNEMTSGGLEAVQSLGKTKGKENLAKVGPSGLVSLFESGYVVYLWLSGGSGEAGDYYYTGGHLIFDPQEFIYEAFRRQCSSGEENAAQVVYDRTRGGIAHWFGSVYVAELLAWQNPHLLAEEARANYRDDDIPGLHADAVERFRANPPAAFLSFMADQVVFAAHQAVEGTVAEGAAASSPSPVASSPVAPAYVSRQAALASDLSSTVFSLRQTPRRTAGRRGGLFCPLSSIAASGTGRAIANPILILAQGGMIAGSTYPESRALAAAIIVMMNRPNNASLFGP